MDIGLHRLLHIVAAIGWVGCCQDGHTGVECGHDASLMGWGKRGREGQSYTQHASTWLPLLVSMIAFAATEILLVAQYTTVNENLRAGCFNLKVFVKCLQVLSKQLTKTSGLKRPALSMHTSFVLLSK